MGALRKAILSIRRTQKGHLGRTQERPPTDISTQAHSERPPGNGRTQKGHPCHQNSRRLTILSKFRLKASTEGALTTSLGREFHNAQTLTVMKSRYLLVRNLGNLQLEAVVPGGIGTERKDSARVKTTMTTQNLKRLDQLTTETTLLQGQKVQLNQLSLVSQVANLRSKFGSPCLNTLYVTTVRRETKTEQRILGWVVSTSYKESSPSAGCGG